MGNYQQALQDYQQALNSPLLKLASQKSLIYTEQGLVNFKLNDYSQALLNFDRAIALDSNNAQAYHNRACVHEQTGNHQEAIQDLSKVLELDNQDGEIYAHRGWLYHQVGLEVLAIDDLNVAWQYFNQQHNQKKCDRILAQLAYLQKLLPKYSRFLYC